MTHQVQNEPQERPKAFLSSGHVMPVGPFVFELRTVSCLFEAERYLFAELRYHY
jgi:hypothetical protein